MNKSKEQTNEPQRQTLEPTTPHASVHEPINELHQAANGNQTSI